METQNESMGKCDYVNIGNLSDFSSVLTGYFPAANTRPEGAAIVRNRYAARTKSAQTIRHERTDGPLKSEDGENGKG